MLNTAVVARKAIHHYGFVGCSHTVRHTRRALKQLERRVVIRCQTEIFSILWPLWCTMRRATKPSGKRIFHLHHKILIHSECIFICVLLSKMRLPHFECMRQRKQNRRTFKLEVPVAPISMNPHIQMVHSSHHIYSAFEHLQIYPLMISRENHS